MRTIEIMAENASDLRQLFRQSIETYSAFENLQKMIKKRSTEIAGPMHSGEVAALCKANGRIEVVSHIEYLNDTNKIRWY
jgi:hypothetical protein